jgi:hypothetical protein
MGARSERTYNLFRLRSAEDFCCAVPNDCPVPDFIDDGWIFAGTWHEGTAPRPLPFPEPSTTRPLAKPRSASRALPVARARHGGTVPAAAPGQSAATGGGRQDCA